MIFHSSDIFRGKRRAAAPRSAADVAERSHQDHAGHQQRCRDRPLDEGFGNIHEFNCELLFISKYSELQHWKIACSEFPMNWKLWSVLRRLPFVFVRFRLLDRDVCRSAFGRFSFSRSIRFFAMRPSGAAPGCFGSMALTFEPACNLYWPSTTTFSPGWRPSSSALAAVKFAQP